jgi:chromosome segregation ATPase
LKEKLFVKEDEKNQILNKMSLETRELMLKEGSLEQLHCDLKKKNIELGHYHGKTEELKGVIHDLSARYKEVVQESKISSSREKQLLEQMVVKEDEIAEFKQMKENNIKQSKNTVEQLETSQNIIKTLERKIKLFELKEFDQLEKYQKQYNEIEEHKFERDKLLLQNNNIKTQLDTLSSNLKTQSKKFQEKNDIVIQTIRNEFQHERRKACEEMLKMEELCAGLQTQIDRAIREKRAAESELDKITLHIPAEADRMAMVIEELHSKVRQSDREKNEALQKLDR